ncbi:MAG TPA: endolytic transglycosylase MltG [Chthonomonadales bacterium]|nr:endolytic transglycosylase MltG [Chthonomonadales bacterium]
MARRLTRSRRARRRALWIASGIVAAVALAGAWCWLQFQPVGTGPKRIVRVPQGATPADVGVLLQRRGLVRSGLAFALAVRWSPEQGPIRAGTFSLSPAWRPAELADRLRRGGPDVAVVTVTIPEGYTLRQIGATLERRGAVRSAAAFVQVATEPPPALRRIVGLPSGPLEGYLWPDTYFMEPDGSPEAAARMMLVAFADRVITPHGEEIRRSGRSLHEVVTIASIIEREARVPEERARIAGVVENRLRKRMRLQICATVLYALGEHRERVLYRDLLVDSPYNTYRHAGLPPGPIASPGLACILAALRPERHGYLYYVAMPDGSHLFTRTQSDHLVAVSRARRAARAVDR